MKINKNIKRLRSKQDKARRKLQLSLKKENSSEAPVLLEVKVSGSGIFIPPTTTSS